MHFPTPACRVLAIAALTQVLYLYTPYGLAEKSHRPCLSYLFRSFVLFTLHLIPLPPAPLLQPRPRPCALEKANKTPEWASRKTNGDRCSAVMSPQSSRGLHNRKLCAEFAKHCTRTQHEGTPSTHINAPSPATPTHANLSRSS